MKNKRLTLKRIALKRFQKKIDRKNKIYQGELAFRKYVERREEKALNKLRNKLGGAITYESILQTYLPPNTSYLLNCENCDFSWENLLKIKPWETEIFKVPETFSLIDKPDESFYFLKQVLYALLKGKQESLYFDYESCRDLEIAAQVFLDIIIKDVITVYNICARKRILRETLGVVKVVGLTNQINTLKNNESVLKILYSVGSMNIHAKKKVFFKDTEKYELCEYTRNPDDTKEIIKQKDAIDTSTLVDYVRRCLQRFNKDLAFEDLTSLTNIVTETLINAQEHSTVGTRFSIGYYQDDKKPGNHSGIFRLVIMNFGKTIYEKFADSDCGNPRIVEVMRNLSSVYTKRNLFLQREFEEETLWTLYALQDGVTSVSPEEYETRGSGTIQFIKSFFKLNGEEQLGNYKSRMTILSGNTCINFDGTYKIVDKVNENGKFGYMTFNESGNIEDKPDEKFVRYVKNYFPGTIIGAKIWLDEESINNDEER